MKERILLILILVIAGRMAGEISESSTPPLVVEYLPTELPVLDMPKVEASVPLAVGWPMDQADYITLSSPFGERDPETVGGYGDDFHDGLDLFGTWLARIRAGVDAFVACVFPAPNGYYRGHPVLGGLVILQLEHNAKTYLLVFGHMAEVLVAEGDYTSPDTLLGRQGDTGRSDGPHLHYAINEGGTLNVATGEITGGTWLNPLQHTEEPI